MLQKLTILGTGTIVSVPGRKCAGYLLETDNCLILIDCGPGTLMQLSDLNVDFSQIKYIFLTHFHIDHISDLFAVIHSRWLRGVPDNDILFLTGPYGLRDIINDSIKSFFKNEKWITPENIVLNEVGETFFEIADHSVQCLFTYHTSSSICYRINDKSGKSFFYSGDSNYNENIVLLGNGATIAVIECSHSNNYHNTSGHMTASDVTKYSKRVKTDNLLISHFYPELIISKDFELIKQDKNITIANDLDTYLFY